MDRVRRLADEYDVTEGAVKMDESRMDNWIDNVANTASFEKKAAFILAQHRSQTEGHEQLAQTARNQRQDAQRRKAQLEDTLNEYRNATPDELGIDPAEYYRTLSNIARQLNIADDDVFDWAREERMQRQAVAENVMEEMDARQSLGEIEEKADKLEVEMEQHVTERKLIAGIDLSQFPGINDARLIGADILNEDGEMEPIEVEGKDDA